MKFCIEYVGGDHPHNMRLMPDDQRAEILIEEMELCFCNFSEDRNMDVYAITPEQAMDFISRYFAIVPQVAPAPESPTAGQDGAGRDL